MTKRFKQSAITLEEAKTVLLAHREAEEEQRIAELREFVGRFFKYRNSYSCPKPNERWWLYGQVTSVEPFTRCMGWTFQRDYQGRVTIEPETRVGVDTGGWQEIVPGEFWEAARGVLAGMTLQLAPPKKRSAKRRPASEET